MPYCIYLRKSRADRELEYKEDVLLRHKNTLLELAKKRCYNITKIFEEIVSGETLASRPQMQKLLTEVENGLWDGVLVVEIERLARGNTIDQGIVAQAFKCSNTLIITPSKVYNPQNEYDEEYFEFGLFMSRREYKTINRRLNAGKLASCKEGKYVGSIPPYGFRKEKLKGQKGWVLIPDIQEAEVVKLIYNLYLKDDEKNGFQTIANRLSDSNIPARKGGAWGAAQIKNILTNDVYIGKIHWKKNIEEKKSKNGNIVKIRKRNPDCLVFDAKHKAIIDLDTYNKVQDIIHSRKKTPNNNLREMQNPFAGVLVCDICGKPLKRRPVDKRRPGHSPSFCCITRNCPTVGAPVDIVEKKVLYGIECWLKDYKFQLSKKTNNNKIVPFNNSSEINHCTKKLNDLQKQLLKTYTLLEQGIYDNDTFLDRQSFLKNEIDQTSEMLSKLEAEDKLEQQRFDYTQNLIPRIENLLEIYNLLPNAQSKNSLIKKLFAEVRYSKTTKGNRWNYEKVDDFELEFVAKIPEL